jgi:BON domain
VRIRTRSLLAVAAGLWITLPLPAQEPTRLNIDPGPALTPHLGPAVNQKLAEAIAEHLRQSGRLRHYAIDVVFQDGTADLTGTVADPSQHDEVIRMVRDMPGVERVVDHVVWNATGGLLPVQAPPPLPIQAPPALPVEAGPMPNQVPGYYGPNTYGPNSYGPNSYGPNFMVEPQPVFQSPTPGPYDLNPPKMPPYAWPTYAPYNNYSRVGYPELYPPLSWPFIGPLYPFPKVPLGWRSVKLEWQDGHWWLSRYATPHDWWMLKYW